MNYQSIAYNNFSENIQEVKDSSLRVILKTVQSGAFPGSQLYLYFRLHTPWCDAIDPSEFITDTAFIYKYKLPKEEQTISMLNKYYKEPYHVDNIYEILMASWELMGDSEPCLKPYHE
ncbi:hypothetical protein EXM22_15600 [Oceanispirochaeta crateris]|uniref:Uncharacterized protein n=1 Tax=Oceanispirochaeta crateris TaxID=2518645 RepID=A0A5C1QMQ0_9SPIO|nr:hypothetical protein [Oceanispirochaeta crateris]QEN09333.1 hypothetical protein EXM22_15600 [Oceanispirochaeta crateris]